MNAKTLPLLLGLAIGLTVLGGCAGGDAPPKGQSDSGSTGASSTTPPTTTTTTPTTTPAEAPVEGATMLPSGLFVAEAPADPQDISVARAAAKPGETITIRGRIGGTHPPFVKGRAIVTVADLGMLACSDREGDACERPWDYCCVPSEELAEKIVSVRVSGANGKVLAADLEGVKGLKPLSSIIVRGKVRPIVDGGSLEIDAEAIFVAKP